MASRNGEFTYCAVEARQYLKNKVSVCSWSPKTDLIALGSYTGVVSVHRYKMACVWESCIEEKSGEITGVVWRSDGKSLAASCSNTIRLYMAQDGFVYHTLQLTESVVGLRWTTGFVCDESDVSDAGSYFPSLDSLVIYNSDPAFPSSAAHKLDQLISSVNDKLTFLVACSVSAVHVFIGDSFVLSRWSISSPHQMSDSELELLDGQLSSCLRYFIVLLKWTDPSGQYVIEFQTIPCQNLQKLGPQLRTLAVLHSSLRIGKTLLDDGFDRIRVSWEDMILEMDSKFTNYAREQSKNQNWSLCVELLEFLLFGNCPAAFRKFLVEGWTAPSLKRTGTATLKSYESIKTICFQQLHFILLRLLFNSSELLGYLRDTQLYSQFQVSSDGAASLCNTIAAVLQKTQELYITIEKSITHLRAFFKWLYVAILDLSGRVLPNDFPRVTSVERELVIDFITHYLQPVVVNGEVQSFSVDLVEQYIRSGEVRRPLEKVVEHSLDEDKARASLRKLINLSSYQGKGAIPVGLFNYDTKASLADLIEKKLAEDLSVLFSPPTTGNFTRGCFNLTGTVSRILCRFPLANPGPSFNWIFQPHSFSKPKNDADQLVAVTEEAPTLFAWTPNPDVDSTTAPSSFVIMKFSSTLMDSSLGVTNAVHVCLDDLPSVANRPDQSYVLRDFEFFTSGLLVLLVGSASKTATVPATPGVEGDETDSWLVMLPIENAFPSTDSPSAIETMWSSSSDSLSCDIPKRPLSSLINAGHIEALPWPATKLTTNGDRSIVFVLFRGSTMCRVYLLDRPEVEESNTHAEDNPDPIGLDTQDNVGLTA